MSTFDFKAATPVTSGMTDSNFLMGAASQSDSTPTLYQTVAVRTYILGTSTSTAAIAAGKTLTVSNSLTLAGTDSTVMTFPSVSASIPGLAVANTFTATQTFARGTITDPAFVFDSSVTWNDAADTFVGWKLNVTNTNSAAASLLMDLQVGGTSRAAVGKGGDSYLGGYLALAAGGTTSVGGTSGSQGVLRTTANTQGVQVTRGDSNAPAAGFGFFAYNLVASSNGEFAFWSATSFGSGAADTWLSRSAAANIRLGQADAAAPVAQTLSVQSVVTGTTDTAGANWTHAGSRGTGTGAGGSLIFQTAPASSTGNTPNALANALTIASTGVTNVSAATATPAAGSTAARLVFGTTSGFGIYYGSGAPTVSAAQGSLYMRSDGSGIADRLYVNTTGSTTWTNFVSAA